MLHLHLDNLLFETILVTVVGIVETDLVCGWVGVWFYFSVNWYLTVKFFIQTLIISILKRIEFSIVFIQFSDCQRR